MILFESELITESFNDERTMWLLRELRLAPKSTVLLTSANDD